VPLAPRKKGGGNRYGGRGGFRPTPDSEGGGIPFSEVKTHILRGAKNERTNEPEEAVPSWQEGKNKRRSRCARREGLAKGKREAGQKKKKKKGRWEFPTEEKREKRGDRSPGRVAGSARKKETKTTEAAGTAKRRREKKNGRESGKKGKGKAQRLRKGEKEYHTQEGGPSLPRREKNNKKKRRPYGPTETEKRPGASDKPSHARTRTGRKNLGKKRHGLIREKKRLHLLTPEPNRGCPLPNLPKETTGRTARPIKKEIKGRRDFRGFAVRGKKVEPHA